MLIGMVNRQIQTNVDITKELDKKVRTTLNLTLSEALLNMIPIQKNLQYIQDMIAIHDKNISCSIFSRKDNSDSKDVNDMKDDNIKFSNDNLYECQVD